MAAAAQELLNKSDNERSGVLSTAMSFLGLYRDPVIAQVTGASDWRITDLVDSAAPVSLYLVIPPSDISRTKPLVRLMLNQIGRRLTEELRAKGRRQRVMFMLDEFPALGRLDFFESALAFVAGYGIKAFLIAQSLNQIEKAYGSNNAILDNCHVRVAFAANDDNTASRVSNALGTATQMRAMKNYAGHRLSPWLGHIMVSRTETARPLLTPAKFSNFLSTRRLFWWPARRRSARKRQNTFSTHGFARAFFRHPSPNRCTRRNGQRTTGLRSHPLRHRCRPNQPRPKRKAPNSRLLISQSRMCRQMPMGLDQKMIRQTPGSGENPNWGT